MGDRSGDKKAKRSMRIDVQQQNKEEASNFVEEVKKFKGHPINITPLLMSSLNASIISLLIGRRLNKDEEANKIKLCYDYADVAFKYVGPSEPISLVPGLRKLCEIFKIGDFDHAAKTIRNFASFVRDEIIRHKTSPALRKIGDFINSYLDKLSALSKAKDTKHNFSVGYLKDMYHGSDKSEVTYWDVFKRNSHFRIYFIYNPPKSKPDFSYLGTRTTRSIFMGDFNAHSPAWGYKELNEAVIEVEDLIFSSTYELLYYPNDLHTYLHYNGNTHSPDLLLVTSDLSQRTKGIVLDDPGSRHQQIIADISFRVSEKKPQVFKNILEF
ncbi:cytochrome P450 2F3 [Trichonephila inaurata madagascariensis]|nr:cytochrome P450 2F3 [Trichonephila inaurata madagascariensis]